MHPTCIQRHEAWIKSALNPQSRQNLRFGQDVAVNTQSIFNRYLDIQFQRKEKVEMSERRLDIVGELVTNWEDVHLKGLGRLLVEEGLDLGCKSVVEETAEAHIAAFLVRMRGVAVS